MVPPLNDNKTSKYLINITVVSGKLLFYKCLLFHVLQQAEASVSGAAGGEVSRVAPGNWSETRTGQPDSARGGSRQGLSCDQHDEHDHCGLHSAREARVADGSVTEYFQEVYFL